MWFTRGVLPDSSIKSFMHLNSLSLDHVMKDKHVKNLVSSQIDLGFQWMKSSDLCSSFLHYDSFISVNSRSSDDNITHRVFLGDSGKVCSKIYSKAEVVINYFKKRMVRSVQRQPCKCKFCGKTLFENSKLAIHMKRMHRKIHSLKG